MIPASTRPGTVNTYKILVEIAASHKKHTDPGFPSSLQHYAMSKHRSAGIREITLASHSYAPDKTSPEHHFIVTSLDYVTYNTLLVMYGM